VLIPIHLLRDQPLQRQIYDQLHELIVTGGLQHGTRMPSTRMLAEQFGISRITVLLTYERLIADGCLETRPAQGTFVNWRAVARPAGPAIRMVVNNPAPEPAIARPDLVVGAPDASLFPAGRWRTLMRGALDHLGAQIRSEHASGNKELREAISGWLSTSRGLPVQPDQIMLFNGRQQALHLAAHLASCPAGRMVVEDPSDANASATLAFEGGELVRVPVDADGLCTALLPEGAARLVYVTPEHQRPLGVCLSQPRRAELLAWARRSGALVVEDDCDGELRYGDMPHAGLMRQDRDGSVMMLGGFSASLGPWLNIAYLVLPRRLVADALKARRLIDDRRCSLEETSLAELIASGSYSRHLHRISKSYAARRDALVSALQQHFGDVQAFWGGQAGLHLTWFPPEAAGPSGPLAEAARACGLEAISLSPAIRARVPGGQAVLLGFGTLAADQITARVADLARRAPHVGVATALSAD
jgi:GntR family transcriptional regulator/MocR family aminotransferase